MEKLKVLIADDEVDAIEVLTDLLQDSGRVSEVQAITESHKTECTVQKIKPDVLFLDIKMPGIDGLTVLENIRQYDQDLPVVYVSAYEKFIPDAIKLHVFSYLLKPVDRQELFELLERLQEKLQETQANKQQSETGQKFKLPVKNGYIYLNSNEIFLLEAEGNYTRIVTTDQQEYLSSYNMGRLAKRIPDGLFHRINRKNYLNCQYLVHINKKELKCTARVNNQEYSYEVSRSFLSTFNKEVI